MPAFGFEWTDPNRYGPRGCVMMNVILQKLSLAAGGGAFSLPCLTLGVFLNDQPSHHLAVNSERRSHRPLTKHQGWLLPAGSEGFCEYDEKLEVVTIAFEETLLTEVGLERPDLIAPTTGSFDPLTLQLILGAEAFLSADPLYRETMSRALAAQLVQSIHPERPGIVEIEDRRLKKVITHIDDHLGTNLSLSDLAGIAAMSPYHFARAFKVATGASPLQYVINARISRAKVLLRTTRMPISQIAFRTGYADPSRFNQHFRSRVGVTPGRFRQG